MASLSVILGTLLIVGLIVLGAVQTVLNPGGVELTAAATANVVASQQDLNLCMNGCMRNCVTQPGSEQPCLDLCDRECGA